MLNFPWRDYRNGYVVYEHHLIADPLLPADAWELIYLGCCKIRDIGVWPDAQSNSEWVQRMDLDPTCVLHMNILAAHPNINDALNNRAKRLAAMHRKPVCNARGVMQHSQRVGVICNETGAKFLSSSEAARAMGVTPSMMSQHLNRKPGFVRVKGMTFRKMVEGDAL